MANARRGNVWFIDTSGALDETVVIKSVILMGGSDAAALSIKKGGASGDNVYESEAATNTNVESSDLGIRLTKGQSPYVTISGTAAKAYIVLK